MRNANGDNVAALHIDLHADRGGVLSVGFHGDVSPKPVPRIQRFSSPMTEFRDPLVSSQLHATQRLSPALETLLAKEVVHSVQSRQQKSRLLQRLRFQISPLTDSNRRPPPYHGGSGAVLAGTAGHARSRFSCKSSLRDVSTVPARARECST